MTSDSEWNDLIIKLDPVKFEQLCADMINAMGYTDINWRKGGGDSGRDIEATLLRKHPDGSTQSAEKWFFECKKYSSGINVSDISVKINWAGAERADYLVFMSNSYLTNPCHGYCTKEMGRLKLKIIEWTDLKFRDILFNYPDLCEYYFDRIPPRKDWKRPVVNDEARVKIGEIEFGNVSKEKAIEMIEDAYKIIQKMKLPDKSPDDFKEKVELFTIEKDIISLINEKESEFSKHFKINVPNPDFYFELALANYYMGNDEKSKANFVKFINEIDKLIIFKKKETGEDLKLDYEYLKFLFDMRRDFLDITKNLDSPTSLYHLAQKADKNTIEITSTYQWLHWDGVSITCFDLHRAQIPIEIFTTEEINNKLKGSIFKATVYYIYINDFQSHIKFKEIHEIFN